jgi:putative flippase GtrA
MSAAKTFIKAQTTAIIATSVDFLVYVALVELFGIWYVVSAALSAASGALFGFLLGRHWCFNAADGHLSTQGIRYIVVSGVSLCLNTSGVYLFTDIFGLHYILSKMVIAVLVAVFFNFPLQRYYVFKVSTS